MKPSPTVEAEVAFDQSTRDVLRNRFARAERFVNASRIAALGALAIAALLYAPFTSTGLNLANLGVLLPMLIWAVGQHFFVHAPRRSVGPLSALNAVFDITAVSVLVFCHAMFGEPYLALKSPMLSAYYIVLMSRPFTGSPRLAIVSALLAAVQYAAILGILVTSGRIEVRSAEAVASLGSITLLDEALRVASILITGLIAFQGTRWNESTLWRAVTGRRDLEARFRAVFDHSAVGVALLNERGAILESNLALSRILGVTASQLMGRRLADFADSEHRAAGEQFVESLNDEKQHSASVELRFSRRDGSEVWGHASASRAHGARDVRFIAMLEDISNRKALEARLLQQAFYDSLTSLANRTLFRDRADHALQRALREQSQIAVLFLDLDNFKDVNDTLGHAAGDGLLKVVADRLLNATRGCDTVARLGGDEFAVLLENVRTDADATVVAERITMSLRNPINLEGGQPVRVTASVGIARAQNVANVDELMRNADVAMYAAKAGARGQYVWFDPAMHTSLLDRVMLESDMRNAIENKEFWVAYQPIVDLETRSVTGMEALARWRQPLKGDIPPGSFIPMAEETGLIVPIGRMVLEEACRQAAEWNRAPGRTQSLTVTVNLSSAQLQSADLPGDVSRALLSAGLRAELLVVEITESVLMSAGQVAQDRLRQLKSLGVRVAIDDFGTGYSALAYLQQFPVDILKIDRSFTNNLNGGVNEDALARTIIALGDLLTLRTIAAGVEKEGQHERLRDLGCDYGQGYLFGRPISAREMTALLNSAAQPSGEVTAVPAL